MTKLGAKWTDDGLNLISRLHQLPSASAYNLISRRLLQITEHPANVFCKLETADKSLSIEMPFNCFSLETFQNLRIFACEHRSGAFGGQVPYGVTFEMRNNLR